jgi:glycine/D-amino acid oxidase-like deaminating enzyme
MTATGTETFDVVIVGGAMIGSAVAWHLACASDFDGRILVVERDPSFALASSSHSNSCMRQQFSNPVNVRISQYCAEFVRDFRDHICDHNAPNIPVHPFGYLYLADSPDFAAQLRANQRMQADLGAGTQILLPEQLARKFPFFDLDGIVLGSFNARDEGYFDGNTMLDWWRRMARRAGVKTVQDEVVAIEREANRVLAVRLKSGARIGCGAVVNAAGPRCAQVAAMAGLEVPVEPRKRYTYVFAAQTPLAGDLPLTVDPTGVHVRSDGAYYMAGATPDHDPAVDVDDFEFDHALWLDKVWPAIAARIPAFAAIRVMNEWVGHYAYNRLDQNAIIGTVERAQNFYFVNGFSGHGFQQAPAMGRAVAELICHGTFQTLDLSDLSVARVFTGKALRENAVI